MAHYCCVAQCKIKYKPSQPQEVLLHPLPKDESIRINWIKIINGNPDESILSLSNLKVCSSHFTKDDYTWTPSRKWKILKPNAVPSRNLPKPKENENTFSPHLCESCQKDRGSQNNLTGGPLMNTFEKTIPKDKTDGYTQEDSGLENRMMDVKSKKHLLVKNTVSVRKNGYCSRCFLPAEALSRETSSDASVESTTSSGFDKHAITKLPGNSASSSNYRSKLNTPLTNSQIDLKQSPNHNSTNLLFGKSSENINGQTEDKPKQNTQSNTHGDSTSNLNSNIASYKTYSRKPKSLNENSVIAKPNLKKLNENLQLLVTNPNVLQMKTNELETIKLKNISNDIYTLDNPVVSVTNVNVCPICCEVFKTARGLARHKVIHKRKSTQNNLKEHEMLSNSTWHSNLQPLKRKYSIVNRKYKCGFCETNCESKLEILKHISSKHKKSPSFFLCEQCGLLFKKAWSLKCHLDRVHAPINERKAYICETCDKKFNYRQAIIKHTRRAHLKEKKKFPCSKCPKRFDEMSHLKSHFVLHTGDFKHICNICGAKFTRPDNMKKHVESNHNYSCTICAQIFTTLKQVMEHHKNHSAEQRTKIKNEGKEIYNKYTKFQCEICNKFLASKQSLSFHILVHEKKKTKNQ